MDTNILNEGKRDAQEFLLYDPKAIARGIYVIYSGGEKNEVCLLLPLFTSDKEMDGFYELIITLCRKWNAKTFN